MIEITFTQILIVVGFFAGSSLSLVVYIYKCQAKRICKIEKAQLACPINKVKKKNNKKIKKKKKANKAIWRCMKYGIIIMIIYIFCLMLIFNLK